MKVAFVNTSIILCGGLITNYEYVKELRRRGISAWILADEGNDILAEAYNIDHYPIKMLEEWTDQDIIIANRWEQIEQLSQYKGRKFQFVQGKDNYSNYGEDWKINMSKARNNPEWELIGVSQYCLEDWNRGVVIPNGINKNFKATNIPKDTEILVEGNFEPNKGIEEALSLAKQSTTGKIVWLGRETIPTEGVECITNPPQKDIPLIYQRAKVLIKLSKSEGFSLPILEAMASGCVPITRDMGGNDFCVYGHNSELPINIKEVLTNEGYREGLRLNGIATAKNYTWEKSVDKYLELTYPNLIVK